MTLLSLNPGDRDVNVELSEENTVAATIQGAGTEDLVRLFKLDLRKHLSVHPEEASHIHRSVALT